MTMQTTLDGLIRQAIDAERYERRRRVMPSLIRREAILRDGIRRMALRIDGDMSVSQDPRILCPRQRHGLYCEWVAGHYGGCNFGRESEQRRLA